MTNNIPFSVTAESRELLDLLNAQPMQQGGGEVVYIGAWAFDQLMSNKYVSCQLDTHGRATYFDGRPPVRLYTAPPSAPVGVEGRLRKVMLACGELSATLPDGPHREHLATISGQTAMALEALAQQPAAVDEAGDSHHG